ncbi:hypothetical protein Dda_5151 [Drechslerella dactyloides]|uniref:F-box domain-containing protein n=1 Tax=Drechslerella dactyloides TaxID=74499 RepID=A0AAD6IVP2_DREDA|nr:hypothetical protein Dda_5151 [Drechslerella dactyloides]
MDPPQKMRFWKRWFTKGWRIRTRTRQLEPDLVLAAEAKYHTLNATPPPSSILVLPDELLLHILTVIPTSDKKTLKAIHLTCHRLCNVATSFIFTTFTDTDTATRKVFLGGYERDSTSLQKLRALVAHGYHTHFHTISLRFHPLPGLWVEGMFRWTPDGFNYNYNTEWYLWCQDRKANKTRRGCARIVIMRQQQRQAKHIALLSRVIDETAHGKLCRIQICADPYEGLSHDLSFLRTLGIRPTNLFEELRLPSPASYTGDLVLTVPGRLGAGFETIMPNIGKLVTRLNIYVWRSHDPREVDGLLHAMSGSDSRLRELVFNPRRLKRRDSRDKLHLTLDSTLNFPNLRLLYFGRVYIRSFWSFVDFLRIHAPQLTALAIEDITICDGPPFNPGHISYNTVFTTIRDNAASLRVFSYERETFNGLHGTICDINRAVDRRLLLERVCRQEPQLTSEGLEAAVEKLLRERWRPRSDLKRPYRYEPPRPDDEWADDVVAAMDEDRHEWDWWLSEEN